MHWEVACCMMETVTVVCAVSGLHRLPKKCHHFSTGSAKQVVKQLACIDSSPALLGKIGLKDCGIALLLSAVPVEVAYRWQQIKESDSNSFTNGLYKLEVMIPCTSSSCVPSIGQTSGGSLAQFPASSDQAPWLQWLNQGQLLPSTFRLQLSKATSVICKETAVCWVHA